MLTEEALEGYDMRNYEREKQETKIKILHAFWEIYKTTRIEKITVKQITEACGIYRTTFYLHYSDVYSILENLEKELLTELKTAKNAIFAESKDQEQIFYEVYKICKKEKDYLTVLVGKKQTDFALRYKKELVDIFCQVLKIPERCKEDVLEQAMLTAMVEVFLHWLEEETTSYQEMYQNMIGYFQKGILSTMVKRK